MANREAFQISRLLYCPNAGSWSAGLAGSIAAGGWRTIGTGIDRIGLTLLRWASVRLMVRRICQSSE